MGQSAKQENETTLSKRKKFFLIKLFECCEMKIGWKRIEAEKLFFLKLPKCFIFQASFTKRPQQVFLSLEQ